MSEISNANIEAINAEIKKTKEAQKSTGGAVGGVVLGTALSFLGPLGTAIGGALGGAIGSAVVGPILSLVKGNRSAWSDLTETQKTDLIAGLANEAAWENKITDIESALKFVTNKLAETSILRSDGISAFWSKNEWARNRVISEVNKCVTTTALTKNILSTATGISESYESSKQNAKALTAIYNLKKGVQPTAEEQKAIANYLALMQAVETQKGLKKGSQK